MLQARLAIAAVLGLTVATARLESQQPAAQPPDSVIFLIEDRIDGLGTRAVISRSDAPGAPYLVDILRSAISPELVAAAIRRVEQHHRETPGPVATPIKIAARTALSRVAASDKRHVDAIVAQLRRSPTRMVRGLGQRIAVGAAVRQLSATSTRPAGAP